jgi:hypothetical protein
LRVTGSDRKEEIDDEAQSYRSFSLELELVGRISVIPEQHAQNVTMSASDSGEPNALTPLGQIGVRAQASVTFDLIPGSLDLIQK